MIKRIALFLCLATIPALFPIFAAAQEATAIIKGVCRDEGGKPIAGASVEIVSSKDSKITVKTNKHGEYNSPGIPAGSYKVSLFDADGTPLFFYDKVPATLADQTVVNFDMAKLKVEAEKNNAANAEVHKQNEKIKNENAKIQALNNLLSQAAQQKKDKQYDAAVATLEQAVAQDQTRDIVYGSLADAYNLDKKFPEAEAAYNKAIALAPATSKSLGTYHVGLALALLQQGKIDSSMDECAKAAQLDPPKAGLCYYNEGAILTNQGKADAANQAFDKAIAADPAIADAYYQKGINLIAQATLSKDNKMVPVPGTAEAFNKYLELAPDGKYAQTAKDMLASIGATVQTHYGTDKKSKK